MGYAQRKEQRFTYADYQRWPEEARYELIDGEAFLMAPAPLIEHQEIAGEIYHQLRSQLDDEQTVHLPSASLLPGTRIRVGIRHGLGNAKPTMVEITLPPDFVVGRPIRLKGLGRRLGPWRGDLYLRFLARRA